MKRAPNVVELDPGLRRFLRTPEGRSVRKRDGKLGAVVARGRREREAGFMSRDDKQAWASVAREALDPTVLTEVEERARALGLKIVPIHSAKMAVVGRTIMVSPNLSPEERALCIARGVAHYQASAR